MMFFTAEKNIHTCKRKKCHFITLVLKTLIRTLAHALKNVRKTNTFKSIFILPMDLGGFWVLVLTAFQGSNTSLLLSNS